MSKILAVNAVYHSYKDDKIIAWQTILDDNGKIKREKIEEKIVHDYYILNDKSDSSVTDIYGNKAEYKIADNKYSLKDLKKTGVKLCEEDLDPAIKWMHKRYEGIEFKTKPEYFNVAYVDIELESGDSFTSSDINNTVYPINLISMKMTRDGVMHTWGKFPYENKENYYHHEDEKELLTAFFTFFRKGKIDVVSGWNVENFDINYLINRARLLGIDVSMSPIGEQYQNKKTKYWSIGGVSILDLIRIYRDPKFHPEKLSSYSLQSVAMLELGRGKMEYDGQINDLWKRDWKLYVDYNRLDVDLCWDIEQKKKYIALMISICHNSLIPFEKGFSAIALAEGQLLSFMHEDNMVMPNRDEYKWADDEERPGGYVEATDGFYEENVSYDFESLYPNLILHSNICKSTLSMHPKNKEGLIKTVISDSDGVYYRKDKKGIIPRIVERNFKERKEFKELKKKYEREGNVELTEYYDLQQMIRKLLLNSLYGVMTLKYFHFYNESMAKTITMGGQHLIQHMRDAANSYFSDYFYKNKNYFGNIDEKNRIKKVCCLVDTDSLFLNVKPIKDLLAPNDDLIAWVNKFDGEFLTPFFKRVIDLYFIKHYGVESEMNFKLEKIISQMIIFGKKNYAVLTLSNEGIIYKEPKMSVTGFASKRSDRPFFCRKKIDETLNLFFATHDKYKIIDFIRQVKKEFINQPIEDISRPSGITDYDKYAKSFEEYDKNGLKFALHTPIHSRASIVYNYIVEKMKLPNQMIYSGSKMKYIYVYPNNKYRSDVIGYIGNYPEKFKEIFTIDYENQFGKTYLEAIQTLFNAVNWGNINLNVQNDDWIE